MQLDEVNEFWKYALHCFFGELGDKAFFVTVLLSGWVASWESVRNSRRVLLHQFVVFAAAVCGLTIHVMWACFHIHAMQNTHSIHFAGMVIMLCLGFRIHLDLKTFEKTDQPSWCADYATERLEGEQKTLETIAWNPLSKRCATPQPAWNVPSPPAWNPLAFGYGSVEPPACDMPDAVLDSVCGDLPAKESSAQSLVLVGFLTVILICVVEVGDQAQYSLLTTVDSQTGAKLAVSSTIGYIMATLAATLIGHIMERTFPDPRLLFATELGFFCMAVTCFSQAVLGLSTFAIARRATALLGLDSLQD
jgi:putative Ca2+/H+ antiporter (TMEM165/GDT1 family)